MVATYHTEGAWVELDLQIGDSEHVLSGPFLVTDEKVRILLVGFNVIEHLIKFNKLNGDEIAAAFVRINACDATALVNLVNSANHDVSYFVDIRKSNLQSEHRSSR
jgi:hypothetical protein